MPSNHLILCHSLLFLPSIFSKIRIFSNESDLCIRWPKDWSHSFSICPSNEYPGLISWIFMVYEFGDFQPGFGWFPCCPSDSQESSSVPQFKSINSLVLSLLQSIPVTSIHDYWKNNGFDYADFCQQKVNMNSISYLKYTKKKKKSNVHSRSRKYSNQKKMPNRYI